MALHYVLRLEDRGELRQLVRRARPDQLADFLALIERWLGLEAGGLSRLGRLLEFSPAAWISWPEPDEKFRLDHTLVRLAFPNVPGLREMNDRLRRLGGDYGFGPDPKLLPGHVWSPLSSGGPLFGARRQADILIGAQALADAGARGQGVNVAIVDAGLDRRYVRACKRQFGAADAARAKVLGWARLPPGTSDITRAIPPGSRGSDHGHMIARNILAIAPEATLWDIPLVTDPIRPPALSLAEAVMGYMRLAVSSGVAATIDPDDRSGSVRLFDVHRPAVVVNAWGVLDTAAPGIGPDYAADPSHPLLRNVVDLDGATVDVVFAAGNCGEPAADTRCGEGDRGPGRSVHGMNALPAVLSVGAVRVDGLPIGLSAQGPGRLLDQWRTQNRPEPERAHDKPDLCAPSHFREEADANEINVGTSAACGVAAGVIAALRSLPGLPRQPSPGEMRAALRATATGTGSAWEARLGYGIINVPGAIEAVRRIAASPPS